MLILQSGCADILTVSGTGEALRRIRLDRGSPVIEIPMAEWHTCVVHAPDTVIMEIKPGPYRPNEFADWAPEEGSDRAAEFVEWATHADIGQTWTQK